MGNWRTTHRLHGVRDVHVFAEIIRHVYNQPILSLVIGHCLAGLITVYSLWDSVTHAVLLGWLVFLFLQSLVWAYLVLAFRRAASSASAIDRWSGVLLIAGAVTGGTWGATALFPGVLASVTGTLILAVMVLGVTAAALAVFSPVLPSYYAFSVLSLGAFAIRMAFEGTSLLITLGVMFVLYACIILISAHNMKNAVQKSIELRFENLSLVEELVEEKNQAEAANRAKSQFLAAANHDWRQPLNALGLFVASLDAKVDDEALKETVDDIKEATQVLTSLTEALLDMSKLDAELVRLNIGDFAVRPVFQRIQREAAPRAAEKRLTLDVEDNGVVVRSDPAMLDRIVRNLVTNAIRYTNSGRISLYANMSGEDVRIVVADTGIGIPAEEHDRIFEEYYQRQNPERDRAKGMGLGLAIVRRLAKILGHPIDVESVPGVGSTFSLLVPRGDIANTGFQQKSVSVEYTGDVAGCCVLVIDDDAMNRNSITGVLQQWKCNVVASESTQSAHAMLIDRNVVPDVIVTDYRLRNDETGADAVGYLQREFGRDIPAIILTGDTAPERLQEASASGHHVLHKPVSSAKLRSLLSFLADRQSSPVIPDGLQSDRD